MSSSTAPIVLLGAFDSKGAEYEYLREAIICQGGQALTVNFGTMTPSIRPLPIAYRKCIFARGISCRMWTARTTLPASRSRSPHDELGTLRSTLYPTLPMSDPFGDSQFQKEVYAELFRIGAQGGLNVGGVTEQQLLEALRMIPDGAGTRPLLANLEAIVRRDSGQ